MITITIIKKFVQDGFPTLKADKSFPTKFPNNVSHATRLRGRNFFTFITNETRLQIYETKKKGLFSIITEFHEQKENENLGFNRETHNQNSQGSEKRYSYGFPWTRER